MKIKTGLLALIFCTFVTIDSFSQKIPLVYNVENTGVIGFMEKFLLGNTTVNTNITTSPYNTDLSPWIKW